MSVLRRVLAWFREAFEAARPARDGRRSGGTMEIKRDRMVFLGYGKYWRSDAIVGLMPIEEERGPKRRANVFVEGRAEPIVASRTEPRILEDIGATDAGWFGHPRGLSTLFFTEMWERFSYYGMKAFLIFYMTASLTAGGLGFDLKPATLIFGVYTSSVWAASIAGGLIADWLLGQYKS